MTTNLTPREQSLYDTLCQLNGQGKHPTKAELIRDDAGSRTTIPSRTRADRYKLVDSMIRKGHVIDNSSNGIYVLTAVV